MPHIGISIKKYVEAVSPATFLVPPASKSQLARSAGNRALRLRHEGAQG